MLSSQDQNTVAQLVIESMSNPTIRAELIADPAEFLSEQGVNLGPPPVPNIQAVVNSDTLFNVVVPFAPLRQALQLPNLPLPTPTLFQIHLWIITTIQNNGPLAGSLLANPTSVLTGMGVHVPPNVQFKVWQETQSQRYIVVPRVGPSSAIPPTVVAQPSGAAPSTGTAQPSAATPPSGTAQPSAATPPSTATQPSAVVTPTVVQAVAVTPSGQPLTSSGETPVVSVAAAQPLAPTQDSGSSDLSVLVSSGGPEVTVAIEVVATVEVAVVAEAAVQTAVTASSVVTAVEVIAVAVAVV